MVVGSDIRCARKSAAFESWSGTGPKMPGSCEAVPMVRYDVVGDGSKCEECRCRSPSNQTFDWKKNALPHMEDVQGRRACELVLENSNVRRA